jgi:hypothetical protein
MEVVLSYWECKVLRARKRERGYFFEVGWARRAQFAIPSERQRNPSSATNPIITKAIIPNPLDPQTADREHEECQTSLRRK